MPDHLDDPMGDLREQFEEVNARLDDLVAARLDNGQSQQLLTDNTLHKDETFNGSHRN